MPEKTNPTTDRALAAIAVGTPAGDLTGVELLALFEHKCAHIAAQGFTALGNRDAGRAASLAITYAQEARQRFTEALAHMKGTHNPVDLEALERDGVTAPEERARFEAENRS